MATTLRTTPKRPVTLPATLRVLAALLLVYLLAPLLAGLIALPGAQWAGGDWIGLRRATLVSIGSASIATLIVAICGVPLGYVLAQTTGRWAKLAGLLVQLPLALPPLASGILLLFLFGPYAPLGWLGVTDHFAGIVLAQSFVAAPFAVIAARSAFAAIDPGLADMAASLGHGPAARFRRVALPIATPGILAGLLLAWLRGFGEFGATVMLAYHPASLPVYTYTAFGAFGLPAMLPVLLPTLVAALAVLACTGLAPRLRRRKPAIMDRAQEPAPATQPAPALTFTARCVCDGFDLDLDWAPASRRLAILGPSGSGKSMTLRLLAGLAPGGTLQLDGAAISGPAETRPIGIMPQASSLLPGLTLWQQLLFPVGAVPGLARYWLEKLGLNGLQNRLPDQLSAGQQQRAALARALMRPARLLLLDEPFSALDAPLRRQLRQDILALQQTLGATTLLVTHDPDEALLLADEVLVIAEGRALQAGPAAELFARPANATVAQLLGAGMAAPAIRLGDNKIGLPGGAVIAVAGSPLPRGALGWAVRPEHILLGDGPYRGELLSVTGTDALLRLGGVQMHALVPPGTKLVPGPCRLDIPADAVQVWSAANPAAPTQ